MIAFFVAFLTFFSTLFGGFVAMKMKDKLHLVLAFASGAVIATALFEILPEIVSLSIEKDISLHFLLVFSAAGFLLFHFLERIVVFKNCKDEKHDKPTQSFLLPWPFTLVFFYI
ncbi:hypothetical protein HY310_02365 [Candidatus Microgenomates bacterium]|nr:hypothetical protein [Candidatus Microgenomates bacterium]